MLATDVCSRYWAGLAFECRRVTLEFVLEAVEPIRIGVGRADKPYSTVDLPVLRYSIAGTNKVVPVIPGSSLKGVLRTASMLACSHCGLTAHSGVREDNCVNLLESQASNIAGRRVKFDEYRKKVFVDSLNTVVQGLCPTCLLYGTPSISSRIFVGDFLAVEDKYSISVKTGVGINRRLGVAARGVLYSVEYVEPNSQFKGAITLLNTPNWMLSLFAASLLAIHDGWLKIGGFKSRGMGRVRIVEDSLVVRLQGMGIGHGRLEPLDTDVDVVDDVSDCGCNIADGILVCQGGSAMALLRKLAGRWYSLYCSRVKNVWEKRFQTAVKEIVVGVGGG